MAYKIDWDLQQNLGHKDTDQFRYHILHSNRMFFLCMHRDTGQNHKFVLVVGMDYGESKQLENIFLPGRGFPSFLLSIHKLVLELKQCIEHFVHI